MQTDSFDSATWKAQRGASALDNKRSGMVEALQASVRVGMAREEVIRLLGEPDSRRSDGATDVYRMGLAMGPDEQYLEVRYLDGAVASLHVGQF